MPKSSKRRSKRKRSRVNAGTPNGFKSLLQRFRNVARDVRSPTPNRSRQSRTSLK